MARIYWRIEHELSPPAAFGRAEENNEITYYDMNQYEMAPNYTYTRHFMVPALLVINKGAYEGLSAEHKAAFDRLTKDFASKASNNFIAQVDSAKEKAKVEGANFIEFDILTGASWVSSALRGTALLRLTAGTIR